MSNKYLRLPIVVAFSFSITHHSVYPLLEPIKNILRATAIGVGTVVTVKLLYDNLFFQTDKEIITQGQNLCISIENNLEEIKKQYALCHQLSDKALKKEIRKASGHFYFIAYKNQLQNILNQLNDHAYKIAQYIKTINSHKLALDSTKENFESLFEQFSELETKCKNIEPRIALIRIQIAQLQKRVKSFKEYGVEKAASKQLKWGTDTHDYSINTPWHTKQNISQQHNSGKKNKKQTSTPTAPIEQKNIPMQPKPKKNFLQNINEIIEKHGDAILEHQREYHADWWL